VAKAGKRECEIVADAKAGKPRLERCEIDGFADGTS
jgi:hypothetical protein